VSLLVVALLAGAPLSPVERGQLCVTTGEVAATDSGLRIEGPEVRAFVRRPPGRAAEIRFSYGGPSAQTQRLASGELRRQFGIKLRAADTCNLVYAMWHFAPEPGLAVLVKSNPGKHTHAECGAHGYLSVPPTWSRRVAAPEPGTRHVLRAELDGRELQVSVDGASAWKGTLPGEGFAFEGPVGLRSDNARLDFTFAAEPAEGSQPTPCPRGSAPGD